MDETNIHDRLMDALYNLSGSLAIVLRGYNRTSGTYGSDNNTQFPDNSSVETLLQNITCDICCYYASPVPYVYISHVLCTHLSTLIIIMGLVSNVLSMITFRSRVLRTSPTVVYLFYLSLSDNIYLFMVFLTRILECLRCLYFPSVAMDIYNRSAIACKGLQYVLDITSDFSTSVILMVAIDRFIACYHPMFHKKNCTRRTAKIIMTTLLCIICLLSAPHHMLYVKHYVDINTCDVSGDYKLRFNTMYMSEVLLFRIIPVYLIASMNILIFRKLWKRNRRMRYQQVQSNRTIPQNHDTTNCIKNIKVERSQLTNVTLLTMSTFYFVCYQPIILCYVLSSLSKKLDITDEAIAVFRNYARVLCILGYSMNFFLYTLSGNLFRKEFKKCVIERIHK